MALVLIGSKLTLGTTSQGGVSKSKGPAKGSANPQERRESRRVAELKGRVRRLGPALVSKPESFLSSLYTEVRGRGILRTSPRRRSKKFVTISHIQAPAKITHLSDTSTLPQEYAADVVWGPALEDAGVETEIRL